MKDRYTRTCLMNETRGGDISIIEEMSTNLPIYSSIVISRLRILRDIITIIIITSLESV